VTLRFDPRDVGEIRVFHDDGFLCRAVSADLAGETVPLREIILARSRRRCELRAVLKTATRGSKHCWKSSGEQSRRLKMQKRLPNNATSTCLKRYRNK